MKRYLPGIVAGALFLAGCASHPMDPTINMKPPKYVEQMPSQTKDIPQNNPGSLFTNGDNLFSDTKAMKVNDIVTVVITEEVKQSSQASKKLSEANTDNGGLFDASVSGGVNILGKNLSIGKTGVSLNMPSMNSSRSFQGSGTQQRNETFQTTISARIVKVLENGNYYIMGTRQIFVDGQKQIIQISGVIRPQDIAADNTIDSKYISDAKIAYKTQGDIQRFTDQNWLAKIWSVISPW